MATFRTFEEIAAWKKARELTHEIYRLTGSGAFAKDYALRDQIRRTSISVMSNIAEGFERDGKREFVQFQLQKDQPESSGPSCVSASIRAISTQKHLAGLMRFHARSGR